jgi:hypothetical protein
MKIMDQGVTLNIPAMKTIRASAMFSSFFISNFLAIKIIAVGEKISGGSDQIGIY